MPSPDRVMSDQIASSLGATPALAPWLSELFADLDALGSIPDLVVAGLGSAGLSANQRVLDLACGKGAVGIALARELGVRVQGVDASAAFVRDARVLAREGGVGNRCRFVVGDVRARRARADAAVMIGLFGAEESIMLLRARVKPGGLYVFDDAVRSSARAQVAALTLAEIRALVSQTGDAVLQARLIPQRLWRAHTRRTIAVLEANARSLRAKRPSLGRALDRFIRTQHAAASALESRLRPALVVARRAQ